MIFSILRAFSSVFGAMKCIARSRLLRPAPEVCGNLESGLGYLRAWVAERVQSKALSGSWAVLHKRHPQMPMTRMPRFPAKSSNIHWFRTGSMYRNQKLKTKNGIDPAKPNTRKVIEEKRAVKMIVSVNTACAPKQPMMNRACSEAKASSGRNVTSTTMLGKNKHHEPNRRKISERHVCSFRAVIFVPVVWK